MGYVERLLARNERIAFGTHQHWIVLLRSLIANLFLCVLILAVVVAVSILPAILSLPPGIPLFLKLLPLVLLVIPFARMGIRALNWWNERYIITNRRVIQTEGVINKHVIDSSLEKVNDVVLVQSALGRMLGYGDVEILTASEIGVNRFERIAGPVRFKTEMLNQKEDMGTRDELGRRAERTLDAPPPTAGDIPELIAELDELRRKGIISEQEFAQKKQELLGKIR
jgi:uncharacterized membrane protein YdbT with pleckstrin-like domain